MLRLYFRLCIALYFRQGFQALTSLFPLFRLFPPLFPQIYFRLYFRHF